MGQTSASPESDARKTELRRQLQLTSDSSAGCLGDTVSFSADDQLVAYPMVTKGQTFECTLNCDASEGTVTLSAIVTQASNSGGVSGDEQDTTTSSSGCTGGVTVNHKATVDGRLYAEASCDNSCTNARVRCAENCSTRTFGSNLQYAFNSMAGIVQRVTGGGRRQLAHDKYIRGNQ